MAKVRVGRFSIQLPRNRLLRMGLGVGLVVVGGLLGWLPVLGYWMVPLGLLVLASDFPAVRRFNRKVSVAVVGWWKGRKARVRRTPV